MADRQHDAGSKIEGAEMTDRYAVINPDTLEAMRRAAHVAKLEARIEKLEAALDEAAFSQTLFDAVVGQRNKATDRIERLEAALLNIVATFGYGSSGGAYKNRYFNCLEIAKAELKHLGLKGQYSNYVKYVDDRKALEGKDD